MDEQKDQQSESSEPSGSEKLTDKIHTADAPRCIAVRKQQPSSTESTPETLDRAEGKRHMVPSKRSSKKLPLANEPEQLFSETTESYEGISDASGSNVDNGTQSKPETVEASEPEKENKKGAGSDEAMDNLETPPPPKSAKELSDKSTSKGKDTAIRQYDVTEIGSILSSVFTNSLIEEEFNNQNWRNLEKLVGEKVRYCVSILQDGGIIHSAYEWKEHEMVKQHGVFTDDGKNAFQEAVSELKERKSLSIAIYSCKGYIFAIVYKCNNCFVFDTYDIIGENKRDGWLRVYPSIEPSTCTSIWEILEQGQITKEEKQSLFLMDVSRMETFCSMEVDLDGTLKWRVEGQLSVFKERSISEAWRSGQKTLDIETPKDVTEFYDNASKESDGISGAEENLTNALKPGTPLTWEDYFMYLAFAVSLRSKDKQTRVGCVLIDPETLQVLSVGYNGYTRGVKSNEAERNKPDFIVHAEANAIILKGHRSLKGAYAFVTLFPCLQCAVKLIQARVKRVYFLSLPTNESTKKSWILLKKAKIELIPYPRGEDGKLQTKFSDTFINKIKTVHDQILAHLKNTRTANKPSYKFLVSHKPGPKDKVQSKWQTQMPEASEAFTLWENWFMFIAMISSIKSTEQDKPEGCLLVDRKDLKMCGMSYRGYPRGIEKDDPDPEFAKFIEETAVSAITNAISLKFKEGSQYYCFATHFPDANDAKYIAQADVTKLYFMCPSYSLSPGNEDGPPSYIDKNAQEILEKARITVVHLTDLDGAWMGKAIDQITHTLKKLDKKEAKSGNTPFTWPTADTFSGIRKTDEKTPLTLDYPLILGGKGGLKPLL